MNIPKIKQCYNCGNNSFGSLVSNGNTPYTILVSAEKQDDGSFKPDNTKVLGVIPIVCNKCGLVQLFIEK